MAAHGLSLPNLLIPFLGVLPVSWGLLRLVTAVEYVLSSYLTTCTAYHLGPKRPLKEELFLAITVFSFVVRKERAFLFSTNIWPPIAKSITCESFGRAVGP